MSATLSISSCEIRACGRVFYSAVGVLIGNSGANKVIHNHIHDIRYSGISVSWHSGYEACHNQGKVIEYNHIHDIGAGYLSDMGGIYTLGPQQGTRLRYNHIHDVRSRTYGGWGIYTDEGKYDFDRFATRHSHSITCVLSSLAQLADLLQDAALTFIDPCG